MLLPELRDLPEQEAGDCFRLGPKLQFDCTHRLYAYLHYCLGSRKPRQHMNVLTWLLATAVVVHGLVAGISFDVAAVKLPTRSESASSRMRDFRAATTW